MFYKIDVLMPEESAKDFSILHYYTQKVYEALNHLGHQCRLLEGQERFDRTLESPPDFTLSFNYALQEKHGFLWCDYIQVPHIMILKDPPYNFPILRYSPNLITTCDGKCFIDLLHSLSNQNVFFLPMGVEIDLKLPSEEARPYEVTCFASYIDYEARPKHWKERFPKDIYNAMMEAIEISKENDDIFFIHAYEASFNECLKKSRDISIFEVKITDILYELSLYLKGYQNTKLLQSIYDAQIHLFKNSPYDLAWNKYLEDKPNIVFHDFVPFEKSIEIIKRTKILLCSTIKKQGTQDRIFYGLACGALSLTNENSYLDENFKDGTNIAFFKNQELDQVNEIINYYLEDELKRKSIARHGREEVMKYHTWDHRMTVLIEQIDSLLVKLKS
jgi:spore maturation protein CgeB